MRPTTTLLLLALALASAPATAQVLPSAYTPLHPCRLYDSRASAEGAFAPGETRYLVARGECNIPESANAVVATVLVLGAATPGAARLWESSLPLPIPVQGLFPPGNSSHPVSARLCYPLEECATDLALRIDGSAANAIVDLYGYFEPLP